MTRTKHAIESALQAFATAPIATAATALFETLGYHSDKRLAISPNTAAEFTRMFGRENLPDPQKALLDEWRSVDLLFQLTADELTAQLSAFSADRVDDTIIESYLFFAIDLRRKSYTRTQLATITRQVNRLFPMPALILFRHGETLTLSIINRRLNKKDSGKDVLEKVTLIKDIRIANPHRAHLEILFDLSLPELQRVHKPANFVALHNAWQTTLDSSALNKKFFKEVANWYFWAVQNVTFPADVHPEEATRNAISVIRLITRLIFVWFIKEKGLVPDAIFDPKTIQSLLKDTADDAGTYYRAILQNLFFATLNQEMGKRKFRNRAKKAGGRDQNYMAHTLYRYEDYFIAPEKLLDLLKNVPFLNGGLFECLDRANPEIRIDGFSDHPKNPVHVPNVLFFGDERSVDLNATYGTRGKTYRVRGLIEIFSRYKFTVTENTPIEEEIALDPELLGKVFENLLAAYNPETESTARKQTGSFYTPREIVNYMVDESLLAYLETALSRQGFDAPPERGEGQSSTLTSVGQSRSLSLPHQLTDESERGEGQSTTLTESRLRRLFAYTDEPHDFTEAEVTALINAINAAKILDPAVGSVAFPMGVLHKLVFILSKLDPHNERWKARQIEAVSAIPDSTIREQAIADVEEAFARNELDYGRKLYLIENGIYGVDIQPIAVQIAKLRFFISLVVDQRLDNGQKNRGIRPLPNLETKFVAANTLLGIEKPKQISIFRDPRLDALEKELARVRHEHFNARTPATKRKYRAEDERLRAEIGSLLRQNDFPEETTRKLANWNPYDPNTSADFFDPEWMFGVTGGFDIVIGNPPYVRQEKIKHLKPLLKNYACYTGTSDLYVYFFERGLKALKPHGILTFISSNKYFRAGYGKKLRLFLGTRGTVRQLIDFGDAPVFTAIAYPSIIIIQNDAPNANKFLAMTWQPGTPVPQFEEIFKRDHFSMPQTALTADGWRLEPAAVLALLEKLRRAGTPLGEYVNGRFYRGIVTGYNKAFVVNRATRDQLIAEHPSSAAVLKPFLRGKDVKRWVVDYQDLWLIFTRRGIDIEKYPAIKKYLLQFKKRLTPGAKGGRKPGSYKWYEIQDNIAYWEEFEQQQIVWGNLATHPKFAFAKPGFHLCAPANTIISDSKYLLGILNSNITQYLVSQSAAGRAGGFLEYKPMYISPLAIPEPTDGQRAAIEARVAQILAAKRADPAADVSAPEREIDGLVYQLYGLTDEEIAIVEGEHPM